MSEQLQSLPAGDPQAGYVVPLKDDSFGAGLLPPDEQAWIDAGIEARQDDTDRVLQAEHDVAVERAEEEAALVDKMQVSSIDPIWVKIGDPPVELHVYGSNFTMSTKILFGGLEEPITFYSETHISTIVTTPLFTSPDFIEVSARETGVGDEGDAVGTRLFEIAA